MTFEELFEIYYGMFRAEPDYPATTDPEWKLATQYYNNALLRLQAYDDTKWNFLYETLQNASTGTKILATGDTTYTAPTEMAEPGGYITYIDSNGGRTNISLVQPHEAQALTSESKYAYFTGDRQSGYVLNVNPAPTSTENGYNIDYVYYKKPTLLTTAETGTTVIEGGDPAFYYNHMLAQRFRASENFPSYQTALRDAEEALKGMKLKNNSGTWFNEWTMTDPTGDAWGA